jgi:hypothetical protein
MPRQTKLTPEIQERIGEALRIGATHKHAAAYGGISETTFYEWLNRNPAFAEFIRAREAEGALSLMALINHAAQHDDWRAAAWILEHRWPEDYAVSRIDIHHSGEVQINLDARMDLIAQVGAVLQQMFADQPQVLDEFAQRTSQLEPLPLPSIRNRKPRTTRKERE